MKKSFLFILGAAIVVTAAAMSLIRLVVDPDIPAPGITAPNLDREYRRMAKATQEEKAYIDQVNTPTLASGGADDPSLGLAVPETGEQEQRHREQPGLVPPDLGLTPRRIENHCQQRMQPPQDNWEPSAEDVLVSDKDLERLAVYYESLAKAARTIQYHTTFVIAYGKKPDRNLIAPVADAGRIFQNLKAPGRLYARSPDDHDWQTLARWPYVNNEAMMNWAKEAARLKPVRQTSLIHVEIAMQAKDTMDAIVKLMLEKYASAPEPLRGIIRADAAVMKDYISVFKTLSLKEKSAGTLKRVGREKIRRALDLIASRKELTKLTDFQKRSKLNIEFSYLFGEGVKGMYVHQNNQRRIELSTEFLAPQEAADDEVAAFLTHELRHAWDDWPDNPISTVEREFRAFSVQAAFLKKASPSAISPFHKQILSLWKSWDKSELQDYIENAYCSHFPGKSLTSGQDDILAIPVVAPGKPPYQRGPVAFDAAWASSNRGIIETMAPAQGGGFLVAGHHHGKSGKRKAWIQKIDGKGNPGWSWTENIRAGQESLFHAVTLDDEGNIYAAGAQGKQLRDGLRAWIAKFSPDGRLLWQREPGSCANATEITSLAFLGRHLLAAGKETSCHETSDDNIDTSLDQALLWIVDSETGKIKKDFFWPMDARFGGPVKMSEINDIAANNGEAYVLATVYRSTQTLRDAGYWITKLDRNLTVKWSKSDEGMGEAVAVDQRGRIFAAGIHPDEGGGASAMLSVLDQDGAKLWAVKEKGPTHGENSWNDVAVDEQGRIFVIGQVRVPGQSLDVWVQGYHPDGNLISSFGYNGEDDNYDAGYALAFNGGFICGAGYETVRNLGDNPWLRCWDLKRPALLSSENK
ncbi:MAG: hypothetical protein HYT79_00390 [Elusimicrobia bacterium]|nr:hypothetical protein [Elusimicrobiota bacterium]